MAERFDRIWHNARLATMRADCPDFGEIEHGLIATRGGHIAYAGAAADFPADADAIKRGVASLTNNVARNNANSIGSRSGVC